MPNSVEQDHNVGQVPTSRGHQQQGFLAIPHRQAIRRPTPHGHDQNQLRLRGVGRSTFVQPVFGRAWASQSVTAEP